MKKKKVSNLAAVDMKNGMTYIGRLVERKTTNPREWLEGVIITKTLCHVDIQNPENNIIPDIRTIYKSIYKTATNDKSVSKLSKLPLNQEKIIATWNLDE